MIKSIHLTEKPLDITRCREFVSHPKNGAEVLFVGTVRNHTDSKNVEKLLFETYKPMAVKEMEKVALTALNKFEIASIAIHHRYGELNIGEIPVVIAVGSSHRKAAFDACEFAIDTLKTTVPIWKKEFFTGGEVWVSAHP